MWPLLHINILFFLRKCVIPGGIDPYLNVQSRYTHANGPRRFYNTPEYKFIWNHTPTTLPSSSWVHQQHPPSLYNLFFIFVIFLIPPLLPNFSPNLIWIGADILPNIFFSLSLWVGGSVTFAFNWQVIYEALPLY